jgi:hypothetical protein
LAAALSSVAGVTTTGGLRLPNRHCLHEHGLPAAADDRLANHHDGLRLMGDSLLFFLADIFNVSVAVVLLAIGVLVGVPVGWGLGRRGR